MDAASARDGIDAIRRWTHRWVDDGPLPGASTLVARHGEVALFEHAGVRDLDTGAPIEADTLFRIYSMTKPVSAVAALCLVQDGLLGLDDPVADTVPSFARLTVNRHGVGDLVEDVAASTPMTVRHLLTHTSGLTYGEGNPGAISRRYVEERTDFGPDDGPLSEVVDRLAGIPLLFEPGTAWSYGVSLDVLGRVIEVAAGAPLDVVIRERITEPLGMRDTGFRVPSAELGRLAALYEATPDGGLRLLEKGVEDPTTLSGGAGLVSTATDYFRFAEMLRGGGALDGVRVLDDALVREMTSDQLPADLAAMGSPTFNETTTAGVGFGLGVSVVVDPSRTAWRCGRGEFAWGGYASTAFWVDPEHHVTVVFMTQVIPSDRYPLREELRMLVADAILPEVAG